MYEHIQKHWINSKFTKEHEVSLVAWLHQRPRFFAPPCIHALCHETLQFLSLQRWCLLLCPLSLNWPHDLLCPIMWGKSDNVSVLNLSLRGFLCFTCFHLKLWHSHECPNQPSGVWEPWKRAKLPQSSQPTASQHQSMWVATEILWLFVTQHYRSNIWLIQSSTCVHIPHYCL